jgi:hypothetical protein
LITPLHEYTPHARIHAFEEFGWVPTPEVVHIPLHVLLLTQLELLLHEEILLHDQHLNAALSCVASLPIFSYTMQEGSVH